MSETPTLPFDPRADQYVSASESAKRNQLTSVAEDFELWETEVSHAPREAVWDLKRDETFNHSLWSDPESEAPVEAIERVEEAKTGMTHAQELEIIFSNFSDEQLHQRFSALTDAIGWLHPIR